MAIGWKPAGELGKAIPETFGLSRAVILIHVATNTINNQRPPSPRWQKPSPEAAAYAAALAKVRHSQCKAPKRRSAR